MNPALIYNGDLHESAELYNSHSSYLKRAPNTPLPTAETFRNEGWNLNNHSKASSPVTVYVTSDTNKSTKDSTLEKVQSACDRCYEFYRNEPTCSCRS